MTFTVASMPSCTRHLSWNVPGAANVTVLVVGVVVVAGSLSCNPG